ncbi:MAG: ABC transporter permease [Lachnospiraceae bacterium]|nr:ABC transporter permease [Lachnospiraceae bacterium]
MKNFRTLVRFELKKILSRKMTWIAFGLVFLVMAAYAVIEVTVPQDIDGVRATQYEAKRQEKENQKGIIGRTVDDALLEEMFTAMATSESAFQPYKDLYNEIGRNVILWEALSSGTLEGAKEAMGVAEDEDLIYTGRRMRIEYGMKEQYLTEGEKDYWREVLAKEDSVPWTYDFYAGPYSAWAMAYTALVLIAIMLAVCLANLFADEHQKKTDQLVLCSRNGRKVLYWAKLTAGMVFTMVSAGFVLLISAVPQLLLFGTDGLQAPIQLVAPASTVQMTFGEAMLYSYVLTFIAALLYSAIILCCSELFRNSTVAVVAVIGVLVLLPMLVMIPYEYRVLSQIFDLNPINVVAIWGVWEYRLVPVPGGYLTMQQAAPILYTLLIGIFVLIGRRAYLKYQVGGR